MKPKTSSKALPEIDGILVHCAHDRLVPLKDINPNPRNYNKHPEAQIELLAKNIKSVGWRHPITVSNLSGQIVAGHARLEAAKRLGLSAAPVNFQNFKDATEEMVVLLADNRLAELAEPSLPEIKDLLLELDTGATDMDLTGFDNKAMEDLMTQFHQGEPVDSEKESAPLGEKYEVIISCESESKQLKLLERFTKEGLKCKAFIL
jgi:ParB-like chromosome segregation protein Spo0J